MNSTNCDASDAGGSGVSSDPPERSNNRRDNDIWRHNKIVVAAVATQHIECPVCLDSGRRLLCLSAKELEGHLSKEHTVEVSWKCSACQKLFESAHGLRIHERFCKGEVPQERPFKCEHCNSSFQTKSGLSQHRNRAHPQQANAVRQAAAQETGRKKGKPPTLMTEEEFELLKQLDKQFRQEKRQNTKIQPYFPHLTNKQIGDLRRRITASPSSISEPVTEQEHHEAPSSSSDDEMFVDAETHEATGETVVHIDIPAVPDGPGVPEHSPPRLWETELIKSINSERDPGERWKPLVERLKTLARNPCTPEQIDEVYEDFVANLASEPGPDQDNSEDKSKRKRGRRNVREPLTRNQRKRYFYARCQRLYDECPKKLADVVMENDFSILQKSAPPKVEDIRNLYRSLWDVEGPSVNMTKGNGSIDETLINQPITTEEVCKKIRSTESTTAAGLDGLEKMHLMIPRVEEFIAKFYSLILLKNYYPTAWRKNRTTLIPKVGKDRSQVKNWRPITISSLLSRIFSGILDKRLRWHIRQTPRQKGFTEENGCYVNVAILTSAIKSAKEQGGVVCIMDTEKAFDTVPHAAIAEALMRKNVSEGVANFISRMYVGCTTTIRGADGVVDITLKRGVKQGDPLSPLLFNLCMEPLLEELEHETRGIRLDENGVEASVLGFADDLIFLAKDRETAMKQVKRAYEYLKGLGMRLSVEKSSTFEYVKRHKSYYIRDPMILIGDKKMAYVEPGESLKYLGTAITPWRGAINNFEEDSFKEIMARTKKLALKPMQKIELLRVYVFPRFIYGLIMRPPSQETMKKIDRKIRQFVKEVLRLQEKTCDAFFYTPKKSGGLGLPEVRMLVNIAALRNGIKAMESDDQATEAVMFSEEKVNKLKSYAKAIRLDKWPITIEELNREKTKIKNSYRKTWSSLISQGEGIESFHNDPVANEWLKRDGLLKPSIMTDAIRLRTNTASTRMTLRRDKKYERIIPPQCRRCGAPHENLPHILGECINTKKERMKRHDEIKNLVRDRIAIRTPVMDEPRFTLEDRLYKPDLVVLNEESVFVVDVTIRYEKLDYLEKGRLEKIGKYEALAEYLKGKYGKTKAKVVPVVIGSRGAVPPDTVQALKELGIKRRDWLTISLIAIRFAIKIMRTFTDYEKNSIEERVQTEGSASSQIEAEPDSPGL